MKLIDTSSWVHALRKRGDGKVKERVRFLLADDAAAWCDVVKLELWMGAKNPKELKYLESLNETLVRLPMEGKAWSLARETGRRMRKAGTPVPTTDLIIYCCAKAHDVEIEHCDAHFDLLAASTRS